MLDLRHNVGNLFFIIRSLVEVHLHRYDDFDFDNQNGALSHAHYSLKKIYDYAHRGITITKRINDMLKVPAKKPNKKMDIVSLCDVWGEVLRYLKKKHNLKKLEMIEHIPAEFPHISCNKQDLLEILYCLAENAIQAMEAKGKLIIRATLAFRTNETPIANIVIADTGPGIPEEIMTHLFEPFATSKPSDEGNGLGLFIVKSLITKNDAAINVSSFKNCGVAVSLGFNIAPVTATPDNEFRIESLLDDFQSGSPVK